MSTYTLSGSGTRTLNANLRGLHVHLATLPIDYRIGEATPTNYFHVGLLRVGNAYGFRETRPLDATDMWLPVDSDTTRLGYTVQGAASITVEEVFLPAAVPTTDEIWQRNPTAITNGGSAERSTSIGDTVLHTYTVPAGRRLLLAGAWAHVSVRDALAAQSRTIVDINIRGARAGQLQTFLVAAGAHANASLVQGPVFLAAGDVITVNGQTTTSTGFVEYAGYWQGTLFDA